MDENVEDRRNEASSIIKTYMGWSAGAAFLPIPYVDLAAVSAIQVKMVADLAAIYDIPFSRNAVKSIIAGLIGSALPSALARGASSFIKAIPGVGTFLGTVTAPAFSSASTYAIGRVFVQHFEAGGNVLNFDPEAMRDHFKAEFDAAPAEDGAKAKAAA
jgi:uncharacterized protein (DUF697 family)